jgi:hypothetical protein
MSLKEIADDMKRRAKASPGEIVTPIDPFFANGKLSHGAKLRLKYLADSYEYRLQVQRDGEQPYPETTRFRAWERELKTFASFFGALKNQTIEHQKGETTYAAVIIWLDEKQMLKDYEQWAETVSQEALF